MIAPKEDFAVFRNLDFGIGNELSDASVLVVEGPVNRGNGRTFRGALSVKDFNTP